MNFISTTVVIGFTAGAGLLIIGAQLRNFFGVPVPAGRVRRDARRSSHMGEQVDPWDIIVASTLAVAGRPNRLCRGSRT